MKNAYEILVSTPGGKKLLGIIDTQDRIISKTNLNKLLWKGRNPAPVVKILPGRQWNICKDNIKM
jgi:hypothetical protein